MPETIKVKLPDGSEKEVPRGTTPLEVARSISPRLADAALVARVRPLNGAKASQDGKGQLVDLARPLESDAEVRILTEKDPEALELFVLRPQLTATATFAFAPPSPLWGRRARWQSRGSSDRADGAP